MLPFTKYVLLILLIMFWENHPKEWQYSKNMFLITIVHCLIVILLYKMCIYMQNVHSSIKKKCKKTNNFLYSGVDPVTSQFISRQVGLIKKSFRCEIGSSLRYLEKCLCDRCFIFRMIFLHTDLYYIKNWRALQVPFK